MPIIDQVIKANFLLHNFKPVFFFQVLRIMRDLCARVSTWAPLSGWPLEVICCGCLETPFERPPFSTAEGFRRVFEVQIFLYL